MKQSADKLKEEYWKQIVQECNRVVKNREMTKTQWLEANNICQPTFYNWQKQFRNDIATERLIENAQEKAKKELVVTNQTKAVEFI